jgi:mRNA interferase MazF
MSNPKVKRGEVWLVRFPFSDLTSTKRRPALVLSVQGEDVIMVGIFSHLPSGSLRKTWVRLDVAHPDFSQSGLKKASLLKAEKIAVIHESVLQRKLGTLSTDLMDQMDEALKRALHLT